MTLGRTTKTIDDALVLESAKRGPFQVSVIEKGKLDSLKNAILTSKVEGTTTIISIVAEGTEVKEGELVCELDASSLRDKETQQEIAVIGAKAAFEQAEKDLDIQKSQNESDMEAVRNKLELARIDLRAFQEGEKDQQISELKAAVEAQRETLSRSQESCNYIRRMVQKGYKNQNDLEAEEGVLKKANFDLKVAQQKLEVLEKFTQDRAEKSLIATVKELEREVTRTEERGAAALTQKRAAVESKKPTLVLESKKHERLKAQIEACKLFAPQDGKVVYANTRDGRSSDQVLIEVGATVRERQAIINLPDFDLMKVNARIHESRISLVKAGQAVLVKVDSFPDEIFNGEVDSVASVPTSTGSFSRDTIEYEAIVKLLDPPDKVNKLRPSMSAAIEILVQKRDDVLQIPMQTVVPIAGKQFAFLFDGKSVEPKELTVGQSNDRAVEVISGLNEGDRVVMNAKSQFKAKIDELEEELAKKKTEPPSPNAPQGTVERGPTPPSGSPSATSSAGGEKPTIKPDSEVQSGPAARGPGAPSSGEGRPAGGPPSGGGGGGGSRGPFDPVARFKEMDANNDGNIERSEASERMATNFENYDADSDGKVTLEEYQKAIEAFRARFSGGGGGPPGGGPPGGRRPPEGSGSGGGT